METRSYSQSSIRDRQPKIINASHQIRTLSDENYLIFLEEILAEILSRLPVKSLLKFRCVSKSWCALISSKHFIQAHLRISRKNSNFTRRKIISTTLLPCYSLKQCSLESLLSGPVADSVNFDYPMKNPYNAVRIVGCCNGLVCIAIDGNHFFLWNPSTKNYKKLPDVDDRMKRGLFITKYGFGFDEFNEDYKVVGILCGFFSGARYETTVKIYSLRTNSWKKVNIFKDGDGLPFEDAGKFVSGKLHWGRRSGLNSKWDIISFDLGSEICGKIEQPRFLEGGFTPSLGVLWDCLCVLCDYPKTNVHVWILKDYGVRESWMKVVTIPYVGDPWKGPYATILCIGEKGEILMVYGSNFVVYNLKDNRLRHSKMRDVDTFLKADVYVESLVSL